MARIINLVKMRLSVITKTDVKQIVCTEVSLIFVNISALVTFNCNDGERVKATKKAIDNYIHVISE